MSSLCTRSVSFLHDQSHGHLLESATGHRAELMMTEIWTINCSNSEPFQSLLLQLFVLNKINHKKIRVTLVIKCKFITQCWSARDERVSYLSHYPAPPYVPLLLSGMERSSIVEEKRWVVQRRKEANICGLDGCNCNIWPLGGKSLHIHIV